jgi:hypothetical protein
MTLANIGWLKSVVRPSTEFIVNEHNLFITEVENLAIVNAVGLTGDKIVAGNTILGVEGTASAGVLSEEEYNNLLLLTDDILTNPNVNDEPAEMFKLYPTMGPITEFAVASEYAPYGGSILFEEENAVRLEIIMEDEFQGRFLIYNDEYEYQPVTDSYAGVTASGIQVTGGHIAEIDVQYYYFELNGLHVEFETVSYHTFDNYLDIIDSIKIIPRNGVEITPTDEFLTVNFDSGMLSSVTFNKTKTKFEFVEESSSTDYSAMTIIATDGLTRRIRFDYFVYNPYAGILDIKTLDTYKGIEIKQATRDFAWFQDGVYVNMLLADMQGVTLDDVKFYIDNLSIVARTTSPDGGTWSEETIPGPEDEGGLAPEEGEDWAPDLGDAELGWG